MKRYLAVVISLIVLGCDSSTTPEPELALAITAGNDQIGPLGGSLPLPVSVRVTDLAGQPRSNERVIWRVAAGGGRTDSVSTTTDANGVASARWILGTDIGIQLLTASAGNASISLRANGVFQFSSVTVGLKHTCALSSTGEAYCWGANTSGQLGDGTATSRSNPTRVIGNQQFTMISAGWGHSCAVSIGGEVFCWGDDGAGQLGLGANFGRNLVPTRIASAGAFVTVAAGFVHTCAIDTAGTLFCWGSGNNTPTPVNSSVKFRFVSAGEFHTCAIATDDSLYCFGLNSTGEIGVGAPFGTTISNPTKVNLAGVTAVTAGVRHTCAVTTQLYCWGRNAFGETGSPPLIHDGIPHVVSAPQQFTMLGAGNVISCGSSATTTYCWGSDGFRTTQSPDLRFTGSITSLGVGFDQVCVVSAGDIYCWGISSKDPVKITRPQ